MHADECRIRIQSCLRSASIRGFSSASSAFRFGFRHALHRPVAAGLPREPELPGASAGASRDPQGPSRFRLARRGAHDREPHRQPRRCAATQDRRPARASTTSRSNRGAARRSSPTSAALQRTRASSADMLKDEAAARSRERDRAARDRVGRQTREDGRVAAPLAVPRRRRRALAGGTEDSRRRHRSLLDRRRHGADERARSHRPARCRGLGRRGT